MEGCISSNSLIPQHLPQYFHVPKFGISGRDNLCFGLHLILGKKLCIWERYDLFFGLHFILGKKLDPCRRINFAKSSPPISKNGEKWSILLSRRESDLSINLQRKSTKPSCMCCTARLRMCLYFKYMIVLPLGVHTACSVNT